MKRYSEIENPTDIDLMRKCFRDAFWNVAYHEHQLIAAHKHLAVVRGLKTRCNYTFSDEDALRVYDELGDDSDGEISSTNEYIQYLVGSALQSVEYHETALQRGHSEVAPAKALLLRCNFTEAEIAEIAVEEIEREMRKQMEE